MPNGNINHRINHQLYEHRENLYEHKTQYNKRLHQALTSDTTTQEQWEEVKQSYQTKQQLQKEKKKT